MKHLLIFVSLVFTMATACAQKTDTITVLSAPDFNKAIHHKDIQLIDVRTAKEYDEGTMPEALNIDFLEPETFGEKFEKLDKKKPVYIYCRSGHRSGQAAQKLKTMGFEKIYDLKGGFMNWPYKDSESRE